jgi:hypothetical protein
VNQEVECLLCKHENLISSPSSTKKKEKDCQTTFWGKSNFRVYAREAFKNVTKIKNKNRGKEISERNIKDSYIHYRF